MSDPHRSMPGKPPRDRATREEACLWVVRGVLRAGRLTAIGAPAEGGGDRVGRLSTRRDRSGRLHHRRLRTLCEDLDELLGRVAEAVRQHRGTAAACLLLDAVTIAGQLASLVSAARPAHVDTVHPTPDRLHETDVLRVLVLVRDLDDELQRAAHGDGHGDGSLQAGALLAAIRTLAEAARSEVACGQPAGGLVEASGPRLGVTAR
jgi:hypothetical protein